MHIKTVNLLGIFFHLVCVMLLICQQRFLFNVFSRFFIFFIKNAFFNVFYSCGQRFLHLWLKPRIKTLKTSYLENKTLKTLLIKNVDDKYIKLFKPSKK